jgi:hypothetical protein
LTRPFELFHSPMTPWSIGRARKEPKRRILSSIDRQLCSPNPLAVDNKPVKSVLVSPHPSLFFASSEVLSVWSQGSISALARWSFNGFFALCAFGRKSVSLVVIRSSPSSGAFPFPILLVPPRCSFSARASRVFLQASWSSYPFHALVDIS